MSLDAVAGLLKQGIQLKELGNLEAAIATYQNALQLDSKQAEVYKRLAEAYILNGQPTEGLAALNQALNLQPNFASAYLLVGNAFTLQNQLDLAIWAYTEGLELQPNSALINANLGSVYFKQNRLSEAIAFYQKALILNQNSAFTYWMLGNSLSQQGQQDSAISCYQKAILLNPKQDWFYLKLAEIYIQKNQLDSALHCYQQILEIYPNHPFATQELSRLLKAHTADQPLSPVTSDPEEFYEGGVDLASSGLTQNLKPRTETNIQTALIASQNQQFFVENAVPKSETTTEESPELEQYKQQAEALMSQGHYDQAIVTCHQALKLKPDYLPAYLTLGNTLQFQGKVEAALRAYSQALELKPDFAEVHANMGTMYFQLQSFEQAISSYQNALKYNSNLAAVHWNLGKVYQTLGKADEAIAAWQKALEIQPNLVAADFNFEFGNTLARRKLWEEAIQSYQRAINLKPNWADPYANIATMRSQQGQVDEAIQYYQKSIELNPNLYQSHLYLAHLLSETAQHQAAIEHYNQAIQVKPDSIDAYANLAHLYSKIGNLKEAIKYFEQALTLQPNWAEVHCRLAHIRKHEQPAEAIANLEKAIELKPDFYEAHQQLCDLLSHSTNLGKARQSADLYCQNCGEKVPVLSAIAYIFAYTQSGACQQALDKLQDLEKICYQRIEELSAGEVIILYEILLFTVSHLRDQAKQNSEFYRLIARQYAQFRWPHLLPLKPQPPRQYFMPKALRIGLMSKHFRRHSVGWCSEALIRELSKITPHVHLYITGQLPYDEVTQRFEQMVSKTYWPKAYPNGFASPEELAEEMRQDQLDILVDLDSMTVPANVQILAYSPAAVCVSWLGFDAPYVSENNYFLCDHYTHPEGMDQYYLEQLIRLPQTSVALDPLKSRPVDRNAVRNSLKILPNQVVYLCVAPGRKTNWEMIQAQVKILQAVPNGILLRKGQGDPKLIREMYEQACADYNVDKSRIVFIGLTKTEEEHRAIYHVADVLLDSYPYNGGTHNLEALSAHLPIVTRAGEQYLSRMGYAFLQAVNLNFGTAWSWEEYTELGIRLGQDANLRQQIQSHLIQAQQPNSLAPLWNPKKLAREMYNTFEKLLYS